MAIAFDAAAFPSDASGASSATFSQTCTGSNRALAVGAYINDLTDTISGVTYNGVAMTQITAGSPNIPGGGGRTARSYLFYLAAPATGANNVVVTATGTISSGFQCMAESYTGVDQTTPQNTSAQTSALVASTVTVTPTTTVDDCWAVSFVRNDAGSVTSSTNYTARNTDSISYGDSNGSVGAAGAKTVTAGGPTGNFLIVSVLFAPTAPATSVKTYFGLATASVKTTDGLAIASRKTWEGLA